MCGAGMRFTHVSAPARIVFGRGTRATVADEVRALGATRALVLSTPGQKEAAETLAAELGPLSGGVFAGAAMHTPVEVTDAAVTALRGIGADCVVALGGGSTVGLGKAIAWRTDVPQVAVATTYAGSEATPILGQTEDGVKTTMRDPRLLPDVVIYDPDLTDGLPVAMSVVSGLNAVAHAVEALYARDRDPVSSLMAVEGMRAFRSALPAIVSGAGTTEARDQALCGAWLCGTVLGRVGMALHHKLCHVLGGTFGLPHAETHAVVLPHAVAFNARAAERELRPLAEMFGGNLAGGLWDFARTLGAPRALRDLGLVKSDLDRAAAVATENAYWNPRPLERDALRALLEAAWEGRRPGEGG